MKIFDFAVCATLVLAMSCNEVSTTNSGKTEAKCEREDKAELALDTASVDFGAIKVGDVVSSSVLIRNNGTCAASLTSLNTDCQCLNANFERDNIEAGNACRLRFELDTHGVLGTQYHRVTIEADNGQKLNLYITADVVSTY